MVKPRARGRDHDARCVAGALDQLEPLAHRLLASEIERGAGVGQPAGILAHREIGGSSKLAQDVGMGEKVFVSVASEAANRRIATLPKWHARCSVGREARVKLHRAKTIMQVRVVPAELLLLSTGQGTHVELTSWTRRSR